MFNNYPNTDYSQINLDWLLARIHELEEKQKESSPNKLPNPFPLTFAGAVTGSYDGSSPVTVNIPQGGGGGAVNSVNGKTGNVVLGAGDIKANPQLTVAQMLNEHESRSATNAAAISELNLNKADKTEIPTVPEKLPNPSALTFTGASTGSYDGSAPLTINIPAGGEGGGEKPWRKIADIEVVDTEIVSPTITADMDGNPFELDEVVIFSTGKNVVITNAQGQFNPVIGQASFGSANQFLRSSAVAIFCHFKIVGNSMHAVMTSSQNSPSDVATINSSSYYYPITEKIKRIRLRTQYDFPFTAGHFEVWGR